MRLSYIAGWLQQGWEVFRHSSLISVGYSAIFVLLGMPFWVVLSLGGYWLVFFILAAGFLLVGPVIGSGYYQVASSLAEGEQPQWRDMLTAMLRAPVSVWVIGLITAAIYLIWVTDALIIYAVYFSLDPVALIESATGGEADPNVGTFLLFSSLLGALLALIVYSVTVFSIPMALLEGSGFVDAVVFSIKSVLGNPVVMLAWALLLGAISLIILLFAMPLMVVVLPVLAYANHAAYSQLRQLQQSAQDIQC